MLRRFVHVAVAASGLILVAVLWPTQGTAWGEAPGVKIISPNPLTVHLHSVGDAFAASFNIRIENDGSEIAAEGFALSVVSDRTYASGEAAPTIKIRAPGPLRATTVTSVPVTVTVHDQDSTTLTVVLTVGSPTGIPPSTEELTLTRSPVSLNFIAILAGSAALGALIAGIFFWCRTSPTRPAGAEADLIYTENAFSFKDSWATALSAVITAVGAIFTTTGVLTGLVPGIDTTFFLTVTLFYGVVLVLGPLAYASFQRVKVVGGTTHTFGSPHGFRIAAVVTAIAVGGQLCTIGAIVWLSELSTSVRVLVLAFLGLVAAMVVVYTEMTRRQLWELPPPTAQTPSKTVAAGLV